MHLKERAFWLHSSLEASLSQGPPNGLGADIQVQKFLELRYSISCSRGDFLSKGLVVLGFEFSWMPTMAVGEAGTNRGHNPVNSSRADMHCISHLSTGLAILKGRDDKLFGIWGHVYWGGR